MTPRTKLEPAGGLASMPVYISQLVPPGQVILSTDLSACVLFVSPFTHDGHFARLPGESVPFFTRYCEGMGETARERRRRWKTAR